MSGMPGARTPPTSRSQTTDSQSRSPHKAPEGAGPLKLSVRTSVGKWEAGKVDTEGTSPKTAAKTTLAATRGSVSFEVRSPPPQKSRVAEARMLSNKIKAYMTTSKTTKTEIKNEVKAAADRLYQLLKESEQDQGREPPAKKTFKSQGIQVRETQEAQRTERAPSPPPGVIGGEEADTLRKALEEHTRKLAVNNEIMGRLKEALQAGQSHMEKLSYASVAASRPSDHAVQQTALHSLVVTANDENKTGDQILDQIRKVVNAKEGGFTVERIRKAKDRKIIVGCRTEEERKKIKEKIGEAPELKAQDVKNKNPQIMMRDVMRYNSNEDIVQALRNQNSHIFKDIDEEQKIVEVLYIKRTRNPHTGHVVLRVATEVWRRMLEVGAVHVDLQRVKVQDQSPLVQCSLCLAYGHSRRICTETIAKCGHCGGPHMRTECADHRAGLPPTCCNCTRASISDVHHHAFSSDCTIRRRWDAISRSSIAYC